MSSSSDVTQPTHPLESLSRPSQQTGLPWQSGKHSIVSALAKPAYTFDGSNYGPWRGSFLEFLNAHGLQHHLTDPSPKESDPEYLEWSRLESAVCSWLISSVSTKIMEPLSMTRPARAIGSSWRQCMPTRATSAGQFDYMRSYSPVAREPGLSRATMDRSMPSSLTSSFINHWSWILIHFDDTATSSEREDFLAGYVLSWLT